MLNIINKNAKGYIVRNCKRFNLIYASEAYIFGSDF